MAFAMSGQKPTEQESRRRKELGERIALLRAKRGWSQELLAERIGVDVGTVRRWERGLQQIRSRNLVALAETLEVEMIHLEQGIDAADNAGGLDVQSDDRDLRLVEFVAWLADASGKPFDEAYRAVAIKAAKLESESTSTRHARAHARSKVGRQDLADAVAEYYGTPADSFRLYEAEVAGRPLSLTVMSRDDWLGLDIDLRSDQERATFDASSPSSPATGPDPVYRACVARLADAEIIDKVLMKNSMYRLTDISISQSKMHPTFTGASFADYALRNGLMEMELTDTLARAAISEAASAADTPVRDSLLPSIETATDLKAHVCTGGPVALFAAARPATDHRPADYVLLIQVRGERVMDIPGKLSTIPKGWHQPVGESSAEARLSTTLLRELEEELLGREDLEQMSAESRRTADVLHHERHPEAMRALLDGTGSFRVRCTGFGINLLSGTFELPCLVVIDDERWWTKWGHLIAGNWETMSIESISTADTDGLTALIHDPRWSNEGLFALIEGLRWLERMGDSKRVAAPAMRVTADDA